MSDDLIQFLIYYKLNRRRGSLRKELNVRTPFQAVQKWFVLKHEIFKRNPEQFKNKILNLHLNKANSHQQCGET